jgi:hypothetical protein
MSARLRHGMTVRVSRTDFTSSASTAVFPAAPDPVISLRHGYTVRVSANGPVVLALPAGNGPFRFVDFVIPGGGFARVSVSTSGAWLISPGTGNNFVERLDFDVPGGGAIGFLHDGGGFVPAVGIEESARAHFDFYDASDAVWRVSVDATGQFQFSKQ